MLTAKCHNLFLLHILGSFNSRYLAGVVLVACTFFRIPIYACMRYYVATKFLFSCAASQQHQHYLHGLRWATNPSTASLMHPSAAGLEPRRVCRTPKIQHNDLRDPLDSRYCRYTRPTRCDIIISCLLRRRRYWASVLFPIGRTVEQQRYAHHHRGLPLKHNPC